MIFLHLFGGSGLHFLANIFVLKPKRRIVWLSILIFFVIFITTKNISNLFIFNDLTEFGLLFFNIFLLLKIGEKILGEWHTLWLIPLSIKLFSGSLTTLSGGLQLSFFLLSMLLSFETAKNILNWRRFLPHLSLILLYLGHSFFTFFHQNEYNNLLLEQPVSFQFYPLTSFWLILIPCFLMLFILKAQFRQTYALLWLNLTWVSGGFFLPLLFLETARHSAHATSVWQSIGFILQMLWLLKCATDLRHFYLKIGLFLFYLVYLLF